MKKLSGITYRMIKLIELIEEIEERTMQIQNFI